MTSIDFIEFQLKVIFHNAIESRRLIKSRLLMLHISVENNIHCIFL